MCFKYYKCLLCLFLVPVVYVQCELCSQRVVVTSTSLEPYHYTYRETYQTTCWYGGKCKKTRIKTNDGYRIGTRRTVKTILTCCEGYIRDDAHSNNSPVCLPICMPSCKNGYCRTPGQCACNDGYSPDPINNHNCLPQCLPVCEHGTCVRPNTCECDFGYTFNETCKPICTESCDNGTCIAPDTCECYEGFRKSENNTCDPYCSMGCVNGTCVQPETCVCDDGYKMIDGECVPDCKADCGNGTCIAPDTCECDPGYVAENGTCQPVCPDGCINGYCASPLNCSCNPGYISDGISCHPQCVKDCGNGDCIAPDTCVCSHGYELEPSCDPYCCKPSCSMPCINGSCVEPEFCVCDPGYSKDFITETCVPDCSYDCGHGKCVAPDTCECHSGYREPEGDFAHDPVCQPICKDCEGTCIQPLLCVCDEDLFETRNETVDGDDCDCFENCYNFQRQCERTVCLPKTTSSSTDNYFSKTISNEGKESRIDSTLRSYTYDNSYTDDTSQEILVSESFSMNNPTTAVSENDVNDTIFVNNEEGTLASLAKDVERSSSIWIYVAIAIILLVILSALSIIVVKRKAVQSFFNGQSYIVEDKSDPAYSPAIDLECIAVKKTD